MSACRSSVKSVVSISYPSSSRIGTIASINNSLYGPGEVPTLIVVFSLPPVSLEPHAASKIEDKINKIKKCLTIILFITPFNYIFFYYFVVNVYFIYFYIFILIFLIFVLFYIYM